MCFGVIGLKPWEIGLFTPRELIQTLTGFYKDRDDLRKFALTLTCLIMNASGNLKEPIKPEDLLEKSEEAREAKTEESKEYLKEAATRFGRK